MNIEEMLEKCDSIAFCPHAPNYEVFILYHNPRRRGRKFGAKTGMGRAVRWFATAEEAVEVAGEVAGLLGEGARVRDEFASCDGAGRCQFHGFPSLRRRCERVSDGVFHAAELRALPLAHGRFEEVGEEAEAERA